MYHKYRSLYIESAPFYIDLVTTYFLRYLCKSEVVQNTCSESVFPARLVLHKLVDIFTPFLCQGVGA